MATFMFGTLYLKLCYGVFRLTHPAKPPLRSKAAAVALEIDMAIFAASPLSYQNKVENQAR